MNELPFSPAADRNKQPILDLLLEVLPRDGSALEIASGTGQHVCWFAAAMPSWIWQPTDGEITALPGIAAHVAQACLPNVRPPIHLDVMAQSWTGAIDLRTQYDAIYCANLLHITPWTTAAALMRGVSRHLAGDGMLLTYGPYLEDGVPTAPGNAAFDASLRARNPAWGIRTVAAVAAEAERAGLQLHAQHAMPANNLLLQWQKKPAM